MSPSIDSVLVPLFLGDLAILLAVGVRLLVAALRTHRAAEIAVGTCAACGALGVMLSMAATQLLAHDPAAFPLWAAGRLLGAIGVGALAVGTWRIYRPESSGAAALSAAVCAVAAVGCAIRILPGSISTPRVSASSLFSFASTVISYGWATGEAFRYQSQLRRRLGLALANPLVIEQFRLWGVSGACALAATSLNACFGALGHGLAGSPPAFIAAQVALLVTSLSLWFAFYPPAFYRRRLSSRAVA